MPRRKPSVSAPKETVHVAAPEAEADAEDGWAQVEYVPDTEPLTVERMNRLLAANSSYMIPMRDEIKDVRFVEYQVDALDGTSQSVNAYRRQKALTELHALLADGYTLLSSAGGAHGSGTLFVFTLAK